jgi:transcriptional regulator with XRE-family HTH domain
MGKDRQMPSDFGEKLRVFRKKNNFSLKDLELMTGVHASYIHLMEKGKRQCPSYPIIEKIAFALSIKVGELIGVDLEDGSEKPIHELWSLVLSGKRSFSHYLDRI